MARTVADDSRRGRKRPLSASPYRRTITDTCGQWRTLLVFYRGGLEIRCSIHLSYGGGPIGPGHGAIVRAALRFGHATRGRVDASVPIPGNANYTARGVTRSESHSTGRWQPSKP